MLPGSLICFLYWLFSSFRGSYFLLQGRVCIRYHLLCRIVQVIGVCIIICKVLTDMLILTGLLSLVLLHNHFAGYNCILKPGFLLLLFFHPGNIPVLIRYSSSDLWCIILFHFLLMNNNRNFTLFFSIC